MTTTITVDGVTFDSDMFAAFGYLVSTTVDGTSYPAWQALFVAMQNEMADNLSDVTTISAAAGAALPVIRYAWDTGTSDADPGSGKLRANNATLSSATTLYLSTSDTAAVDVSAIIGAYDDSTNTVRGYLAIGHRSDPTKWVICSVTGSVVTATGYRKVTVVYVAGPGGFGAADPVAVGFARAGDVGAVGGAVDFAFSTTTTDADPGNGTMRLNNATQNTATTAYVDLLDAHGTTVTTWLDALDDSTNTIKGELTIQHRYDPSKYLKFNVTGSVAAPAGYRKLTLTNTVSSASSPFADGDPLAVSFARAGDVGATGSNGAGPVWAGTSGGTANAQTLTPSPALGSLTGNPSYEFLAGATNTSSLTLNVSGTGATAVKRADGTALTGGEVKSGTKYVVTYDGSAWRLPTSIDLTTAINWTGVTVASASTTDIGAVAGNAVRVTGTTTITALGTAQDGARRTVTFAGVLTLTHNATSLILPTGANITTAAGDVAEFESLGSGNWRCANYARASGSPLINVIGQGLHTIAIPAGAMAARTTNGAANGSVETTTNKVMRKTFDFDTATQEYVQFTIAMPKSWDEGTITFQVIWTAASGSGGVAWSLQGIALSDDDATDTAFGTAQTVTDTLITAGDVHITSVSSAVTIGGSPASEDWVVFQLSRAVANGSDTLGVDACVLGLRLYYTINATTDA